MNEKEIKSAINRKVRSNYQDWTIGITEHPRDRKARHGNPARWSQWRANTEAVARRIEREFLAKGMKGAGGGGKTPIYVYIF